MVKVRTMALCAALVLISSALWAAQGTINVNTAGVEQLMMLPGIGEKTAKAIVSYRQSHGAFKTVDDLARVKGIGMKKVGALRKNLSVQGPNTYIPDQKQGRPGRKASGS
jgi:competence protein ComEA